MIAVRCKRGGAGATPVGRARADGTEDASHKEHNFTLHTLKQPSQWASDQALFYRGPFKQIKYKSQPSFGLSHIHRKSDLGKKNAFLNLRLSKGIWTSEISLAFIYFISGLIRSPESLRCGCLTMMCLYAFIIF